MAPTRVPDGQPRLDPTLDFLRLLWRIEHGLERRSKWMDARIGVTGPQRLVLKIADRFPGLTAGQLARIVRLHPSTITGVIQRLVDKGLLARTADRADRRRVRLRTRPTARRVMRQSAGTIERAVAGVLSAQTLASVRETRDVLAAIARALEDDAVTSV